LLLSQRFRFWGTWIKVLEVVVNLVPALVVFWTHVLTLVAIVLKCIVVKIVVFVVMLAVL
jgi:hypothetical protein